jgi:hypothetical protein
MADQWGANSTNKTKPTWEYLTGQRGRIGNTANVFATSRGWVHHWPWGDEVLVATAADLAAVQGGPGVVGFSFLTTSVANNQATNVQVALIISEPVNVNGTPTLRGITNAGAGEVLNVVFSYSSTLSNPDSGYLVFSNTTAGVLGNTNATTNGVIAGNGSITISVNATSTFGGQLIVDQEEDNAGCTTPGNVSTTFPISYQANVTIVAYKPGLGNTSTLTGVGAITVGAQPSPTTAQTVSFTFQFNEAVTVTGVPTVNAIGTGLAPNSALTYKAASSNVANGTLVFSNTNVDLSGANSATLVVNSTSTRTLWTNIVGASGNSAQDTLGISANTRTIAAS